MPKIIVTSRYLKSGSGKQKQLFHYVKYIATREGSVPIINKNNQAPATQNQQELLLSLINDFPDSKELFEYEDYEKSPTVQNASRLITEIIERNMDRMTERESYVGYLANRPGAVKSGTHGLWNGEDKPIDLNAVAKEISEHKGNVWTHVVSLRRDNAGQMGYDNLKAWRELVKRQIPNIAKQSKIDMKNLRWYAAFHDKLSNPHVHIIVYSVDPRQGFLSKHGIEKIRSGFANDIYKDELHNLYSEQTEMRDQIKGESAKLMHKLAQEAASNASANTELLELVTALKVQLDASKGKKVYGYLKPEMKKTVDDIYSQLAQNESIQKMYELWCELEQKKHDMYSSAKMTFPPLVDNQHFKSVKNMIIKTVLDMDTRIIAEEKGSVVSEDNMSYEFELRQRLELETYVDMPKSINYFKRAADLNNINAKRAIAMEFISGEHMEQNIDKGIEMLKELADSGDTMSSYMLGKIYFSGDTVFKDYDKAEKYLRQSADDNNEYAMYALAKLYLSGEKYDLEKAVSLLDRACGYADIQPLAAYTYAKILLDNNEFHDTAKALHFLEENAEKNNWCSYLLGRLYLFETDEIAKDKEQAVQWLTKSADDGNEYAVALLQNAKNYEQVMLANTVMSLFAHLSCVIEDDYMHNHRKLASHVDKKLKQMINRKKEELGLKPDAIVFSN